MTEAERAILAARLAEKNLRASDDYVDSFVVMALTLQAFASFVASDTIASPLEIAEKVFEGVRENLRNETRQIHPVHKLTR